ncbi:MAG: site-specific integrase [Spirochaetales bacterium]
MYPGKVRTPFSLYERKFSGRPSVWYVRFWDESTGKYRKARSTGIQLIGKRLRRADAEAVAREFLQSVTFDTRVASVGFLEYIENFWTPDSPYVREKALIDKRPLSNGYVKNSHDALVTHARPFTRFQKLKLHDLKAGDIRDWMLERSRAGVGPRRINAALQAMRIAVKEANRRGDLPANPFQTVGKATDSPKEKGVLTAPEVAQLATIAFDDPRVGLVMLLAAECSLRRGEVLALRWGDLEYDSEYIHVRQNFVRNEGFKPPKNGKPRKVPLPATVKEALAKVKSVSPWHDALDLVVFNPDGRGKPLSEDFTRSSFPKALAAIGIADAERAERNLTYHGLRHTFVTLARMAGIPELAIQAITGHKDDVMMDHYSHAAQVLDFSDAIAKMDAALRPAKDPV